MTFRSARRVLRSGRPHRYGTVLRALDRLNQRAERWRIKIIKNRALLVLPNPRPTLRTRDLFIDIMDMVDP